MDNRERPVTADDLSFLDMPVGPRHDITELTYSSRDDQGEPTAFWTLRLLNTPEGTWRFKVRNWLDLHESSEDYPSEAAARAAGHQWLISHVTKKQ